MKKILLVDDSKMVIVRLQNIISAKIDNVELLVAYSYKEAVKHILSTDKIHLAVLDLNLPDVKAGAIVDFAINKKIPSIILTGTMDENLKATVLKKDIVDFFVKQDLVNYDRFINKIKRTLLNYDANVLVVDDTAMQMAITTKLLEQMNINCYKAKDGVEALDIINDKNINLDMVLTDYNMPNMDGMELTLKIREKYDKDKLAIIVLSANETQDIASEFIKIGANDLLKKPYSKIEFKTRVNANLELIDLFKQIRDMASRDFLTGSYNRRFFFESGKAIFAKAKRKQEKIAAAMLDIDKFKNVNDTYGHDAGDVAIQEIAVILNKNLRASDLVARFGGEEYCILLEDIKLEDLKKLFEKIRAAFESNVITAGKVSFSYTVSIGIFYGLEDTLDEMVKKADEGLYFCKENGRNQVHIIE
jgi:diguanylate cyclase (GGDEF)-like protein